MSVWIIELKQGKIWRPTVECYTYEDYARKVLEQEWPNQPNYARVVEYVRKETE